MSEPNKPDLRRDLLLREYACAQERISYASTDLYRTETLVPLAIAVVYAWLYSGTGVRGEIPDIFWLLPVLLVAFGAWRQFLRYTALEGYAVYLREMEEELYRRPDDASGLCWGLSRYWEQVHPPLKLVGIRSHALMRIAFWLLLAVGTLGLAYYEMAVRPDDAGVGAPPGIAGPPPGPAETASAQPGPPRRDPPKDDSIFANEGAIALSVLAVSIFGVIGSTIWSAFYNRQTKVLELAIDTANSEFREFNSLHKAKKRPRPMSSYVIFHYLLFRKIDRTGRRYSAAKALDETLKEVETIFPVYARSRFSEFRDDCNIALEPRPGPDPHSGRTGPEAAP